MRYRSMPWSWLLLLLLAVPVAAAQQQRFRVRPANTSVIEGDSVILRCEVDYQVGQLQWAKEGFAMGYSRPLPGYPRYRLLGDPAAGVHDLEITNVTLEDDGRFQCQVSPNRGQEAIRAVAFLTVLLKPAAVRIRASDWLTVRPKVVQVRRGQHVTLECDVTGAKPAAGVTWQRGGIDITPEFHREAVRPSVAARRNDTSASVTLQPSSEDDGVRFTCSAQHPAVRGVERRRYSDSLTLSVLYPPGAPVISGYADGDVVVRGDKVTLTCTSEGGNPLPSVIWLKNGRRISFTIENRTSAVAARYSFTAEQSDLNAIYQCEATSAVQPVPIVALVQMNVHFGPQSARAWGTEQAMEGDPVHVTCRASSSNPPANITWTINGHTMTEVTQIINLSAAGGWVTTSNLSTVVPPETRRDLEIACYAANSAVQVTEVGRHTVSVLYPPKPPRIGRDRLTPVRQGEQLTVMCAAPGGSPPAELSWTVAGRPARGYSTGPGRSRLQLEVSAADNGAPVTCRSRSPALAEDQLDSVTVTVHFPPGELEVAVSPERLRAGEEAELSCESLPSLPAAQLSWWSRGQQITDQIYSSDSVPAGDHGGFASRLVLRRPLNWTDHGAQFVCKAEVPEMSSFIRREITLNVLHPPVFTKQYYEDSMIVGESRVIQLPAHANPAVRQYIWSRDGDGDVTPTSADGVMNLTSVRRSDAGWYRLEASNTLGAATARVRVDVLYPPEAVRATSALVSPGEDALLECAADAHPASSDTIRWQRAGFDLARRTGSRTELSGARLTSYLAVYDVTSADVGEFTCLVDNGVGGPVRATAALLVTQAPQVERSAARDRSAAGRGQDASLLCRVRASPAADIGWSRGGRTVQSKAGERHSVEQRQVDLMTWESVLRVSAVDDSDYGEYSCTASNRLGADSQPVQLVLPSVPDPPQELRVLNVSSQAVMLGWTPAFDGGSPQTFRLGYAPSAHPDQYRYVDAAPGTSQYTVDQLSDATEYQFSVAAYNRLGQGAVSPHTVTASTTALSAPVGYVTERDSSEDSSLRRPLILAATAVGSALLVINGLLIFCYVRRRYRRKGVGAAGSKSDVVPRCGHESSSSLDVHGGDVTRDVCDVPNMDRDAWLEVVRISPPPEYGSDTQRLARQASAPDQQQSHYGEFAPASTLELGGGGSSSARSSTTPDLLHRTADSIDSGRLSAPARPHGSAPYLAGEQPAPAPPARAYRTLPHRSRLRIPSSLMSLGGSVPPPLACDLSYEHRGHLV